MCNGDCTRPSRGGRLAVIHPPARKDRATADKAGISCSLILHSHDAMATVSTTATFISEHDNLAQTLQDCVLHIQYVENATEMENLCIDFGNSQDGDLSCPEGAMVLSPRHTFRLNPPLTANSSLGNQLSVALEEKIDLEVGSGVVGRKVSIVRGDISLGVGIIGWN